MIWHQKNWFPVLPKNRQVLFLLLPIFILAYAALVATFYQKTEAYAVSEAQKAALDALLSHKAVHRYVTETQRPEIYRLQNEGLLYKEYFSPKTMSFTYIARNIKELINIEREKIGLPPVYFKLAADNPRNPINQADAFESALLARMNQEDLKEVREVVVANGEPTLHVALPIDRSSKGCLKCHGDPANAPAELLALYGNERGFNEKPNSIRALISIRIPLAASISEANGIAALISLVTFVIMTMIYALVYFFAMKIDTEQCAVIASTQIAQARLEQMVDERTASLSIAKEAAEAANRAKTVFLATMSHELHTPMNGIMGLTNIALRRTTDPQMADTLTKVKQSSEKLLTIINDVLDFSKTESERFQLDIAGFKLRDVMGVLMNSKEPTANNKGLKLNVNMTPDLGNMMLHGDGQRLGQILGHLTSNAIKFTHKGVITIRAMVAEESATDILLRFEVEDTGIGIPDPDQKRLFSSFEQVDGSMNRKHGGIGLGLALSKRLAQAMGGSIGVKSEEGVGSIFWLTARLAKKTVSCDT